MKLLWEMQAHMKIFHPGPWIVWDENMTIIHTPPPPLLTQPDVSGRLQKTEQNASFTQKQTITEAFVCES